MKSRSARDAQLLVWSAWMLRGYLKRPKPSICPFEGAIGCILGSCLIVLQQSVNLHTTTQPKQPLGSGRLSPLKIECHSTIDRLNFESHSPSKNISHLSHLSGWEGGPCPRLKVECHSPSTKHLNLSRLSGKEDGPCPKKISFRLSAQSQSHPLQRSFLTWLANGRTLISLAHSTM